MRLSHKLLWPILFALIIFSCSDEGEHNLSVDIPVVFTTGLSGTGSVAQGNLSRAANDSWDKYDQIGIYMIPALTDADDAADFTHADYPQNSNYETQDNGDELPLYAVGNPILFPTDINEKVSFIAYYPYKSTLHTQATPHVYAVDISTQDPLKDIDLLYHKDTEEYSKADREVALVFSHQLCKLTITVVPGTDITADLSDAEARLIGFPLEATFDLSTGDLGDLNNPSTTDSPLIPVTVGEHTETEASFEAILIPHEGGDYTRTINVTVEDKSYSYTFPSTIDLEQGKAYSYNFTLTGRALILTGATITNWHEGGTTNGNMGESMPEGWDDDINWDRPIVFDGESNCYMVPPRGQLLIPIRRAKTFADGTEGFPELGLNEEFYTKVYWSDNANAIAVKDETTPSNQITTIGTGPEGYILVKPGDGSGNAIVALQKKNEDDTYITLWSWHVWVTDYDPEVLNHTNTYNNNNNGDHFVFMDRNLGALNAGLATDNTDYNHTHGLYYQWGRKDPFPSTGVVTTMAISEEVGTIAYVVQNPTKFIITNSDPYDWLYTSRDNNLWGHGSRTKSIYDPCPTGWCVPSHNVAFDIDASEITSPWYGYTDTNGDTWSSGYIWSTNAAYPAGGYRYYNTGNLLNSGTTGNYWSASPYNTNASAFYFYNGSISINDSNYRSRGFAVRCVREF